MRNAKKELEDLLIGKAKIKCAKVVYESYNNEQSNYVLKVNHTEKEFQSFLESLNFDYNCSFGIPYLFGIIWLNDGTWCTRDEYEGSESEWWEHNQIPEIPSELM